MSFTLKKISLLFSAGVLLLILTACTVLSGGAGGSTATPLPTASIQNMEVVSSQACKVAEQDMIRVQQPQGNLIAWSPKSDTLTYIAPTQASSWNVGELNLLSAPGFDSPHRLASGAAGELTWSPDGSAIAYLGLRRSDNLYTISLAFPNGSISRDLFPDEAARTDDYSSQKAILEWTDPNHLRVLTSCGINCLQTLDINTQTGLASEVGDAIEKNRLTWSVHTNQPTTLPGEFSNVPGQLNWSPDEKNIAYIDDAGNAWVINASTPTMYPLDIGQYGTAAETDWSYDSQYLAVHVDQNLLIFSLKCP